jgi:hypothetical protein
VTSALRGRARVLRSPAVSKPGPSIEALQLPTGPSGWEGVSALLAILASTRAVFPTETARSNWISSYEPGRRFALETEGRSSWIQIEYLQTCWQTFERLGRVRRRDVLEPGRCSALVMALFERVAGVDREGGKDGALVLARDSRSARSR